MAEQDRKKAFEKLTNVHSLTESNVLSLLQVDLNTGLKQSEVEKRRATYGRNEFPKEEGKPLWLMILEQFQDVLVIILIGAALIGFILAFFEDEDEMVTAFVEPLVIILILIANATVGVLQESSAEKAVEALKAYESPHAAVLRDGKISSVDATELVPGDIVEVEVGDLVPADIRVLKLASSSFEVAQAMLTGENYDVEKVTNKVDTPNAQLQDKNNIIFSGTNVTRGKCRGIVIGTGVFTEKGKIRDQLQETEERDFPLKRKLDEFGHLLSKAIGVICVLVWLINIRHFSDPVFGSVFKGAIFYFKIAISLAVAAIPEGLPAVVTTCLALGTQRMAAKNAIITVLPAVETLGCTSVICSDKTGTLTTNKMSVKKFFVINSGKNIEEFSVEGDSYDPYKSDGSSFILTDSKGKVVELPAAHPAVFEFARVASVCNDSSIIFKDNAFDKVGQSTEAALKVLVEKIGFSKPEENNKLKKLSKSDRAMAVNNFFTENNKTDFVLEFNRSRKSMSVLVSSKSQGNALLVKGAWDNVLTRCTSVLLNDGSVVPLTKDIRQTIEGQVKGYCGGNNCYRCLTLAQISNPKLKVADLNGAHIEDFINFEQNLTFIGVCGILDPPRQEVKPAIEICNYAGIRVIVITGDNKDTAVAICRSIGIFEPNEKVDDLAFSGVEFKAMSEEKKLQCVKTARLFARVEPVDKKTLVDLLHKHNQIVAMTGDGVNDAPALKAADIGIAMGSGTAVAKGAAAMVLADDNFSTIVSAVEEGRNLYNNTKQFIRYLITSNIGEVVAIFLAACTGLPEVLQPVQLLWVNLVTDGLPAVALGFNKGEEGIMNDSPRPHDEPIVNGWTFLRYFITGTYVGFATVAGMIWWYCFYESGPKLEFYHLFEWARCTPDLGYDCEIFEDHAPGTVSLSVLVTIEMFCALNSLSEKHSLLSASGNIFSNFYLLGAMSISFGLHFVILYVPFLAAIFQVEPISLECWVMVVILSFPVILIDEVIKVILRTIDARRLAAKKKRN